MSLLTEFHNLDNAGLLALRIGVSVSFLVHGVEKKDYWHKKPGGGGSESMLRMFRFLSIAEPLGGVALLTGFLTRIAAIGIALIMLGAIRTKIVKWKNDFGEDGGWEIDWILLWGALALIALGPGRWSADALLFFNS